ncbi:MAG TPA: 5-(carboxyamino)imidazole ribonucleotide synthase [Gemmatimonadaceae bacterium]|nr:5-(carboxyamino)imidazole ribonucleotide synthase [Gemmatimonadaceae bacterium]
MTAILPGAVIGFLGGGQLGRMAAMAARSLGYGVVVLDPDPRCPASAVADGVVTAPFSDADAVTALAERVQVLTIEIEQVSVPGMRRAAARIPVRPGPDVVEIIQDRSRQKAWLAHAGAPVGPWRPAGSAREVAAAVRALGRSFVKACTGGYDGRGQAELVEPAGAAEAWESLGSAPVVVEGALPLAAELSVLVARRPSGEIAVYPPALNHHQARILDWSVLPAPLAPAVARRAAEIATTVARALMLEGILAIEMFLLGDGQLLVNELAPRPHNTFHATELACATSQFEQLVRAICDLPLGDAHALNPAAIVNLLGDLWTRVGTPAYEAALAVPGVHLTLYGKTDPRPGRKMGHLTAVGASPEEAVARVRRGEAALQRAEARVLDASALERVRSITQPR